MNRTKSLFFVLILGVFGFLFSGWLLPKHHEKNTTHLSASPTQNVLCIPPERKVTHIHTPEPVRAIYMTSYVSGIPNWRNKLIEFIKTSEVNSIIIDIKDYSGHISYDTQDPEFEKIGAQEIRVKDLPELIEHLHREGIYTIARITVFQDPLYTKHFPQYAVQTHAGATWRDKNGLSYVDPSATPYWDYVVRLGKNAIATGFDEINFDYVRFPTDGNMKDMVFPLSGPKMAKLSKKIWARTCSTNMTTSSNFTATSKNAACSLPVVLSPKAQILSQFYTYLHTQFKSSGIPISADLFGMVLTNRDDLNIGQVLEIAAPNFDYIGPMIYPSHYPHGFKGYNNPAAYPYEIVHYVLKEGGDRLEKAGFKRQKLRPWLQDFNLGAIYDNAKIRAQKKGVYDAGLTSWMMWDPRNKYTVGGYDAVETSVPTTKKKEK